MNKLLLKANAKINLGLRIKYKRDDGFHEIESIFQEIDFSDEIILKPNQGIKFMTNSDELNIKKNNLLDKIPGLNKIKGRPRSFRQATLRNICNALLLAICCDNVLRNTGDLNCSPRSHPPIVCNFLQQNSIFQGIYFLFLTFFYPIIF